MTKGTKNMLAKMVRNQKILRTVEEAAGAQKNATAIATF